MAKDAIVSDDLAKKFATEKDSPYVRWVADEGLDIISAHYVPDLNTVELKPWARRGGRGVFINHEASRTSNDCYVCEIPAGKELTPQRQLFEEMVLVLSGHGSTSVWNDAGQKVTFEWGPGAMFAIPLNTWHQHFNGSGTQAARFVSSTNMPPVHQPLRRSRFRVQHRPRFRRAGSPASRTTSPPRTSRTVCCSRPTSSANSIDLPLISAKERGAGGGHIRFSMAKGSMNSHISQFATATYKKGHRHGPGAHVIILTGEGFSLMWPEGEEPRRYEWKPGHAHRAAEHVVPPALQHRRRTRALPRLQARGGVGAQCPGCSEGVDQQAHRR